MASLVLNRPLALQSCFPDSWPQHVLVHGIIPVHVQDSVFLHVELIEILLFAFLQHVQISLNCGTVI